MINAAIIVAGIATKDNLKKKRKIITSHACQFRTWNRALPHWQMWSYFNIIVSQTVALQYITFRYITLNLKWKMSKHFSHCYRHLKDALASEPISVGAKATLFQMGSGWYLTWLFSSKYASMTESDFWYDVIISRWRSWRPPALAAANVTAFTGCPLVHQARVTSLVRCVRYCSSSVNLFISLTACYSASLARFFRALSKHFFSDKDCSAPSPKNKIGQLCVK